MIMVTINGDGATGYVGQASCAEHEHTGDKTIPCTRAADAAKLAVQNLECAS